MITSEYFGTTRSGERVTCFTLSNQSGVELKVIDYGCIVVSIITPDRKGTSEDIVLGFETIEQYEKESPFFGAVIGRYGNRIAKGKFSLDGVDYQLAINNGPNHLHGGVKAFDKVMWKATPMDSEENPAIKFEYLSPDGDEGYPGNLRVHVVYTLTADNAFNIKFKAETDKKTVVNLCQHTYFNLSGNCKESILDHEVLLNADRFVAIDDTAIPTGELKPVKNSPFDFTTPVKIGDRIDQPDSQLANGNGYDHTFVFNPGISDGKNLAASIFYQKTGRYVEVFTTEPGVQLYTGNYLQGYKGKDNAIYHKRYGVCLETQHFPDSPNRPEFPSVVLVPGTTFKSETTYKFSVREN